MKTGQAARSPAAGEARASNGVVVVYAPDELDYVRSHEKVTRIEIAKTLATLKGFAFAGDYDPLRRHPGPVYFVPSETLGVDVAHELGIASEHDLFGGVVPYPFVATKAITHPLVAPDAPAPAGWSHEFACRVGSAVLSGFTVFTCEDARRAGVRLFEHGPVRIKPVRATGGRGQSVVAAAVELEAALAAMDAAELSIYGLVLEENLSDVTTYSVGQVRVSDLVASYCGTQRLTPDNSGEVVYGGSELAVVRGDFDALLALGLPADDQLAVAQARVYDAAASELFPGLFASRRNCDVAQGLDGRGRRRSGVLEPSWRIGGASGAEVAALETFWLKPGLHAVRASCVEIYGEGDAPPQACISFRGLDDRVGPILKYTLVEPYDDA